MPVPIFCGRTGAEVLLPPGQQHLPGRADPGDTAAGVPRCCHGWCWTDPVGRGMVEKMLVGRRNGKRAAAWWARHVIVSLLS